MVVRKKANQPSLTPMVDEQLLQERKELQIRLNILEKEVNNLKDLVSDFDN